MSKHSMRSGASGRSSASWSATSARARALWSEARRSLWRANDSRALSVAVSRRSRLPPRCGTRMRTFASAVQREELLVELAVFGLDGDEDLLGEVVAGRVGVELLDDAGDERGRLDVFDLVDDEALAPDHSPLAHVEHLHARFERVLVEADEVEVFFARRDHLLAFDRLAHARELVAHSRGELELELVGRLGHALLRAA